MENKTWCLIFQDKGKMNILEGFSVQDVLMRRAPWLEKRPDFLLGVKENGALHQFSKEKTKSLTLQAAFYLTPKQASKATEEDYKNAVYFLHTLHPAVQKPKDYSLRRREIYERVRVLRGLPPSFPGKETLLARQTTVCRQILSKEKQRE